VKYCIERDPACVKQKSDKGRSPVFLAAMMDKTDVIEYLAKHGANLESTSNQGFTAMHFAALSGKTDVIKCLAALGADANAGDCVGMTAIFLAAAEGHIDCIKRLVALGADINIKAQGMSPLSLAVNGGHTESPDICVPMAHNKLKYLNHGHPWVNGVTQCWLAFRRCAGKYEIRGDRIYDTYGNWLGSDY